MILTKTISQNLNWCLKVLKDTFKSSTILIFILFHFILYHLIWKFITQVQNRSYLLTSTLGERDRERERNKLDRDQNLGTNFMNNNIQHVSFLLTYFNIFFYFTDQSYKTFSCNKLECFSMANKFDLIYFW
jgi:hypothetical protein